jgi:hypothetical protein
MVDRSTLIVNWIRDRRAAHLTREGAPCAADPTIVLVQSQRLRVLIRQDPCEVYAPTQSPAKRATTVRAALHVSRRIEILPRAESTSRFSRTSVPRQGDRAAASAGEGDNPASPAITIATTTRTTSPM